MKIKIAGLIASIMILPLESCTKEEKNADINVLFLHHSTGEAIWNGTPSFFSKVIRRINTRLSYEFYKKAPLPKLFLRYNKDHNKNYVIDESVFPKSTPYGWNNYPFDYYNIWVKNAGNGYFMEEPTLEVLTKKYQVIIFKHCYPVSKIQPDKDSADIDSDYKSVANYKLQYLALRDKLQEFPDNKFILFTGAVNIKSKISEEEAGRTKEFFDWVINEWDLPGDNIYLWDLYNLQTEGSLYFKESHAYSADDSHPNAVFSGYAVNLLFSRIIDVIDSDGSKTTLTGEKR